MGRLVALRAQGAGFVTALQAAWDRDDAVLPVDPRLPTPAAERLSIALRVGDPVEDGDALVMATSGTTGEPRGAVLTHAAVAASARASSDRLAVDPSRDVWLACLPLAHVGGLSVVTRALLTGTPLVVHDEFDPAAVAAAAAGGATLVSLVATALARVDASGFRTVVLGGSAPPASRPANVVTTYGMTESGSGVVYDGRPLDGVEVRVDAAGQIHLRAPMLLRAYRNGSDPKDSAGWFATGDVGAVGADGRLRVDGRADDLIVTGGENVWPDAVEAVLTGHGSVAEVAVVGRPDGEWGARVTAFVVPSDAEAPPTLEQVRAWVKEVMPAYAAPRELELVRTLPRTALGKVKRAELRAASPGVEGGGART